MAIVFKNPGNIEVDGVAAGDLVAVIANYPSRKAEAYQAFKDYRRDEITDKQERIAAAQAATEEKVAEIATLNATHAAAMDALREEKRAALDALRESLRAEIQQARDARNELIEKLGGTEAVQELKRLQRIAERQARKAALLAEVAEIDAVVE